MENMDFIYCSDCRLKRCAKEKEQRKNGVRTYKRLTREQQQKKLEKKNKSTQRNLNLQINYQKHEQKYYMVMNILIKINKELHK